MKKINIILIIGALAIIIAELIFIATSDVSWSKIRGPLLTVIAMIFVIIQAANNMRTITKQTNPKK